MGQRAPWPYTLAAHSPSHRVRPYIGSGGVLLECNREETTTLRCSTHGEIFFRKLHPGEGKCFETSGWSWRPCTPAEHNGSNFLMFVDENAAADWIALAAP